MYRSSRLSGQAGYSIASALVFVAVLGLSAIAIENTFPAYERESLAAAGGVLAQGGPETYTPPPTAAELDKAKCEEKKQEAIANGGISKILTQQFSATVNVQTVMEKNRCTAAIIDKDGTYYKTNYLDRGIPSAALKDPKAYKCIGETTTVAITMGGTGDIVSKPNPSLPQGACMVQSCDSAGICRMADDQYDPRTFMNPYAGGTTPTPTPGTPDPTTPSQPPSSISTGQHTPELYGPPLPPGWDLNTGFPSTPSAIEQWQCFETGFCSGGTQGSANNNLSIPPIPPPLGAPNFSDYDAGPNINAQNDPWTNRPMGGLNQGGLSGDALLRQIAGLPPAGAGAGTFPNGQPCTAGTFGCRPSEPLPPGWTYGSHGQACQPGMPAPGCPGAAGTTFAQQRPGMGMFGGSTMGGYQQPSLLSSFLGGLTQGLVGGLLGNGAMGAQQCSRDPAIYAQQQQMYQMQMQQYQMQMQQIQFQQRLQQYPMMGGQQYQPNYLNPGMMSQTNPYQMGTYGYGQPYGMPYGQTGMYGQQYGMPQMPQPCSPPGTSGGLLGSLLNGGNSNNYGNSGGGSGSGGNQCPTPPQQPPAASCSTGYWKAVYSGVCLTNWQCTAVGQLRAEISCQPRIADAGMTLAISYACSSGTASSNAFQTTTQPAGTTTVPVATPPIGANTATYSMTCTDGVQTAVAQCSIQVANPTIALAANPISVSVGSTSVIGWITSGMRSCVVSSPDQSDFTARNASSTSPNGTAVSSPISTTTRFMLQCETHAGGNRSATTSVTIASATTTTP